MRHCTFFLLFLLMLAACGKTIVVDPEMPDPEEPSSPIPLEGVAKLLSSLPIGPEQMSEVADAVNSSAGNGYDCEYTMQQLFSSPGSGIGETEGTKAGKYSTPLRDLIADAVRTSTRAGEPLYGDPEDYLAALSASDLQIYWPYADSWNGSEAPVITFDPGNDSDVNTGYVLQPDGSVSEMIVGEDVAQERPVWVINRNTDSEYKSLEMLRREDPNWGNGGGNITITPRGKSTEAKTLVIKTLCLDHQFDSWFAGGSELMFKMGAVESFKASSEAELRNYKPTVTDFLIVVKRGEVGITLPINTIMVSEWTKDLQSCAFMIHEDDGGAQDKWKCSAIVKWNSKSYGFETELPIRTRDDIVWRGQLTRSFVEKFSGKLAMFGEVGLVMELI